MRLLVYILTTGILLFNLQLRGQEINSYNVNAILDVDNKSIEVKQIMKFRNTSNIQLNEMSRSSAVHNILVIDDNSSCKFKKNSNSELEIKSILPCQSPYEREFIRRH